VPPYVFGCNSQHIQRSRIFCHFIGTDIHNQSCHGYCRYLNYVEHIIDTFSELVHCSMHVHRETNQLNARHSQSRPSPHYMVLPPGEFDGMIPEQLSVDSESFMATVATVFS